MKLAPGFICRVSALAVILGVGPSAYAASQQGARGSNSGLEEVIVTAQRRTQNLQKVPLSVSAISANEIKEQGLTNSLDISNSVPNVEIKMFGGVPNIFIRGVGNNDFNATTISPVSIYRDGVALISTASQIFPLFDIQRIEVLRGPQGTLFGRNTTGGAISYISKRPGDKLEGDATVGYGRFNLVKAEGGLTVPVNDDLSFRVSGLSRTRDGQRTNVYTGKRVNNIDVLAGRLVGVYKPNEDLKVTGIYTIGRNHSDYPEGKPVGILPGGVDALGYKDPYPNDPAKYNYNTKTKNYSHTQGGTLIVEYNFGSALLKSISGVDFAHADNYVDVDMSPNVLDEVEFKSRTSEFSQEVNLSGKTSRWTWIGGFYYSYDHIAYDVSVDLLLGAVPLHVVSARATNNYAGYGQATFSLTPRLRLTGGLRYTSEKQRGSHRSDIVTGILNPAVPDGAPIPALPYKQLSRNDTAFSWRVALDYDLTDNILAYASVNRGFKSGGFYLVALLDPLERSTYKPETLTAYEIGLKSEFFGRRLQLNADAFHYDYTDLQVLSVSAASGPVPSIVLENAATANVNGGEIELKAKPTERLSVWGNLGLLDAHYGSYPSASVDANGNFLDYSGNRLPGAPSVTFNGGAQYDAALTDNYGITVRGEYAYLGRRYFSSGQDPIIGDGPYGVVNARLSLHPNDGNWEIALWGKNLADTVYLNDATNLYSLGFSPHYLADRRSYGIEFSYRYR